MIKHLFRLFMFTALIATISMPSGVQAAQISQSAQVSQRNSPGTVNTLAWYDGLIQYSSVTNCFSIIQGSPYTEYGVGTYVGFQADPDNSKPAPNVTYYAHVVIAGLGNPCSGGTYAYIDISLPPDTTVSVDLSNPIRCFHDNVPIAASDCFQSLSPSSYNNGAQAILSPDNAHGNTWPVAQGHSFEFQIPVKSTTMLANSPFQANILALDGNSSPWLHPQQGIYVFNGTPQITYPNPSTTQITKTSAYSQAYIYTGSTTGTGYFDLGTTTSYGILSDPVAITSSGSLLAWDDWLPYIFTPNTLYHWRFRYITTGAQTYYGADQTFLTLSDGAITVGQGAAAGCTETAFDTALATNRPIVFNCGASPLTITLTSSKTISASNLVIDGGDKVTLASSGSSNLFNIQSGAHLTLNKVTLSSGRGGFTCGGAIHVAANAQLDINDAKFLDNQSNAQGGAICNYGTAAIKNTLFQSNFSNSHGGAIMNASTLTITGSKFDSNSSTLNGGAIDTGGSIVINLSTFNANTAGLRGGGINAYFANLTIAASTFSGNLANMYGGGLASDASTTNVSASTFSGNNAPTGGGIEMNADSGPGSLALTNTTVTANHATTGQGGGLFWTPPATYTASATLLNTTFGGNTAIGTAGNIYAGGAANPKILVKNTIITGGSPNNCDHALGSQGHNLESANDCGFNVLGDLINKNPLLAPLQNYGGYTMTRLLKPGSPAIDAGTNTGCPAVDQRGQVRPQDGIPGGAVTCDIGAVEVPAVKVYLPITIK